MKDVVRAIAHEWPRSKWNDSRGWFFIIESLVLEGVLPHHGKVILVTQPPNSPDLNINDLGLFAVIQVLHWQPSPKNSLELIDVVKQAHRDFPARMINHVWLTLQECMNEIIDKHGGNDCAIPHMSKEKLEKAGRLPNVLEVTPFTAGFINTMTDPDFVPVCEGDCDWEEDTLPGRISCQEMQDLLTDQAEVEEWNDEG